MGCFEFGGDVEFGDEESIGALDAGEEISGFDWGETKNVDELFEVNGLEHGPEDQPEEETNIVWLVGCW